MPNNLVFNEVASRLKTQIYGTTGTELKAIMTDSSGNLIVSTTTVTAIALPLFTESSTTIASITPTSTATAMTIDTSLQKDFNFFIRNTATDAILTAQLQIAPTDVDAFYVNDNSTTITGVTNAILTPVKALHWTRLLLTTGADTASATVYYTAQSQ